MKSLTSDKHGDDRSPMKEGAEYDMDVPDAVIVRMLGISVVDKEIDSRRVSNALQKDE